MRVGLVFVVHARVLICLGERPTARWIVNFDVDFIDGLVIGTCLSAYAPFLVSSD